MSKLVVTGVDGPIGSNIALALSDRHEIRGFYEDAPVDLDGCETFAFPNDPAELGEHVAAFQPDWMIHCGWTSRNAWSDPGEAPHPSEASLGRELASVVSAARSIGARLIVLSSDSVFAGPRLFHEESAPTVGATWLGSLAVGQERQLEQSGALVVRTHAYGWSPTETLADFAQRTWTDLLRSAAVHADMDRHATPILATDLADLIEKAYLQNVQGTLHLAGGERSSVFRFAAELAVASGASGRSIEREQAPTVGLLRTPLRETSLNTWKARQTLHTRLPMLREGLQRFAEQATNGFRRRMHPQPLSIAFAA